MTDPYVALFCHPKSELKMPQPPEPFSSGEPNYHYVLVSVKVCLKRQATYIDVPHALPDIIAARSGTGFSSALASQPDPRVLFKSPDPFTEQARSHEVQEASTDDEEKL